MKNTYRTWIEEKETFFISDREEQDYYCEAPYYEDSHRFDEDFISELSKPATDIELEQYKMDLKKYTN